MSHFRYPGNIQQEAVILNDDLLETTDLSFLHPPENNGRRVSETSPSCYCSSSSDSSTILAPRKPTSSNVEERRCWICFGDSSDSQGQHWVKACQCSLEAHESCLLDWIAESQKDSNKKVKCPQCATTYQLVEKNSVTLTLMTMIDSFARATTPYIAGIGLGCSLLISCTTYGAYSVMSFFGIRDGERLLGEASHWSLKTWIGLPMIPFLLVSSKTRYGDAILPIASISTLRMIGTTPFNLQLTWPLSPALTIAIIPWVRLFYKNAYQFALTFAVDKLSLKKTTMVSLHNDISDRERVLELNILTGGTTNLSSVGFAVVGTLLWPMISSGIGDVLSRFNWVKHHFPEQFQRSILGGCLFIVAKDIGNLIYRYERIQQFRSRRVQSYSEILKKSYNNRRL